MFFGKVKVPGCEHGEIDGWHVPNASTFEQLKDPPPRRWSLIDQLSVELKNPGSRWLWIGVVAGLAVGITIQNVFIVGFTVLVALFFGSSMPRIIRSVRHGALENVNCRELTFKGYVKGTAIWHGYADLDGNHYTIPVLCEHFEQALKLGGAVECKVLTERNDTFGALVAYRMPASLDESELVPRQAPTFEAPVARPALSILGSVGLATISAGLLALASYALDFRFVIASFLVGGCAGIGASWGGRSKTVQTIAAAAAAVAYFAGLLILVTLMNGGIELWQIPDVLWSMVAFTFTSTEIAFLAVAILAAWSVPRGR